MLKKCTWMHPRFKHWHLIDYIIVQQSWPEGRVSHQGDAKCRMPNRSSPRPLSAQHPFRKMLRGNCVLANSTQAQARQSSSMTCSSNLRVMTSQLTHHLKHSGTTSRILFCRLAQESLGFSSKKNQDWFDENDKEIQELLAEKRSAHQANYLAHPSCSHEEGSLPPHLQ